MQGVTLAPPSGQALAELIATGRRPELLEPFRLDRFPRVGARTRRRAPGRPPRGSGVTDAPRRLRVAIIGSGNIGTDLLMKVERSPVLELVGVAGIDPDSAGLRLARERGHAVTDQGLAGLLDLVADIDLAFDATSAARARRARAAAGRARHPQRRPDAGRARPGRGAAGQSHRARRRARDQPHHLRRAGDDPDRGRPLARRRGDLRRDGVDHLVAVGRAGHAPEHRRVHDRDGRAGWRRSAAPARRRRSSSSTRPTRRS